MNELNAQIETISSEQLDQLFGSSSSVPTADNLIVGKEPGSSPFVKTGDTSSIPQYDSLDLDKIVEDEKAPEEKVEDKKEPEEKPKEEEKVEDKKEPSEEELEQSTQIKSILKNTVDYLIERGVWQDFDGREDLEIDEDTYAELAAKQDEVRLGEMFNELVDSTGDYGKAIINHIKKGGNPDEIIDIFKEQKAVESTDISSEDGQTSIVEKYYTEVLGWNKTRVDKHINRLRSEDGELEEEAKDIQDKYESHYKAQLAQIEERREAEERQAEERQRAYVETLTNTIDTFDGFTDKERKMVKDSVLKFDKKLQDGTKVNDFYLKFSQIQNNPEEYVELIHYIMDKKGFIEKVNKKADAKAVDKSWKFVKGNASVKKTGAQIPEHQQSKTSKIDFSGLVGGKK